MTAPLPPYRPGSPAWRAGYEHAKRQMADEVMCGCPRWAQVIGAGRNSPERWRLCSRDNCGAIAAADILAMRPSPPRYSPGCEPEGMAPTPYAAPTTLHERVAAQDSGSGANTLYGQKTGQCGGVG